MNQFEEQYLALVRQILAEGKWIYNERTRKRCLTIPNAQFTYDVESGNVPHLTVRKTMFTAAVAEIIGYLRAYDNANQFNAIGSPTWFQNANETEAWLINPNRKGKDDLGKIYGGVARDFNGVDLIDKVYNHLSNGIDDRGETISFWNPADFHLGCLRPCLRQHTFSLIEDDLYMTSEQRSCDVGLGLVFNAVQCFFLLGQMAKSTNKKAKVATHNIINPHIYEDHIEGIEEMLSRTPIESNLKMEFTNRCNDFERLTTSDDHASSYFKIIGDYDHHPQIVLPMSA